MRSLLLPLFLVACAGCSELAFSGDGQTAELAEGGSGGNSLAPEDVAASSGTGDGPGGGIGGGTDDDSLVAGSFPQQGGAIPEVDYLCTPMPRTQSQHVRALPELGSTASATWALAMLRAGRLPPREALVTEEFLAHFGPPPDVDAPALALHVVGAPDTDDVKGSPIDFSGRVLVPAGRSEALRLIVVADVSPSMRDALPLLRRFVDDLPGALRAPDHVALVTFAGEPEVAFSFAQSGDELDAALAGADLSIRPGNGLDGALATAAGLAAGEPAHVLLVTDGREMDDATAGTLAAARALLTDAGLELSVGLVGKPDRGSADPLAYHRAFADALRTPRGRVFFFAKEADVDTTVSPLGFDRAFGVGVGASRMSFSMTQEFTVFAGGSYGVGEDVPLDVPGADVPLAPGFAYPVWLTGQVCDGTKLFDEGGKGLVAMGLELVADGQPLVADAWTLTNVLEPTSADALPLLDRALFGTLQGLRTRDLTRFDDASEMIAAARAANGCPRQAPACDTLFDLSEIVLRARGLVAAGAPD